VVVVEVVVVLPAQSHTLTTDVATLSILRTIATSTSSTSSTTIQTLSPTHTTTTHEVGQLPALVHWTASQEKTSELRSTAILLFD
jgi:hypothetical protein